MGEIPGKEEGKKEREKEEGRGRKGVSSLIVRSLLVFLFIFVVSLFPFCVCVCVQDVHYVPLSDSLSISSLLIYLSTSLSLFVSSIVCLFVYL